MSENYRIEVQDYPLAVVVDDQQYERFTQALVAAGEALVITIGAREVEPMCVSWATNDGNTVNGSTRVKLIAPVAVRAVGTSGWHGAGVLFTTDAAEEPSGTLDTLATDTVIRDETFRLQTVLALLQSFLLVPAVNVEWADRLNLDTSTALRSVVFLTDFIRGDGVLVVNGLIRRRWTVSRIMQDGVEMVYLNTHDNTHRLMPDAGVVIASLLKRM